MNEQPPKSNERPPEPDDYEMIESLPRALTEEEVADIEKKDAEELRKRKGELEKTAEEIEKNKKDAHADEKPKTLFRKGLEVGLNTGRVGGGIFAIIWGFAVLATKSALSSITGKSKSGGGGHGGGGGHH